MMGTLGRMLRALAALVLALLAAASPAAAQGGLSSLLSGYGGPGDGEQAILGQQVYGGGGTGRRAATPSRTKTPRAPSPTAIYAVPAPAAPAATPAAPAKRPAAHRTRRHHAAKPGTSTPARPPQRVAVVPAAKTPPAVVVRPTSAPAPLGGMSLLLIGALVVALLFLGLGSRRLAVLAAQHRRGTPRIPTAYAARPTQAP